MAFFKWLFGSGGDGDGVPECPFVPLGSDEVARRAAWLQEWIGGIDPFVQFASVQAHAASNPTDPIALHALGAAQVALGDYQESLDTWYQAIFHDKDTPRLVLANRIKGTVLDLYLDDPEKAQQHYTTCQLLDPNWPEVKVYQAEMAYRAGNHKEVKRLLAAVTAFGLPGPLGEAEAALHAEDHEGAVEALQVANWITLMQCMRAIAS